MPLRILRGLAELREPPGASAVTIGNFDGVHLAHQRLLGALVEAARRESSVAAALTFDPHPSRVLAPERAPRLLTSLERKAHLMERLGVDLLVVLPFTRELSRLTPEEFVRQILVEKLRVVSVHAGSNFRFGYQQAGDIEVLANLARREGFRLEIIPPVDFCGERVSSTRIRELLSGGHVGLAGRLLGRPYSVCGAIVPGLGVGRAQTVPTLNMAPVEEQLPKIGVYVTRTRAGSEFRDSVTNVGHKPTFGQHRLTVESFLLNFSGETQGTEMEVEFLYRLRDEIKFPSPAALKQQIQHDVGRALKYFRLLKLVPQQGPKAVAPSPRSLP